MWIPNVGPVTASVQAIGRRAATWIEDQSIQVRLNLPAIVLLLESQCRIRVAPGQGKDMQLTLTAEPLRVVKTAAELESPENDHL